MILSYKLCQRFQKLTLLFSAVHNVFAKDVVL
ncbi:unnamed protein product [Strongylus vulgaris]|uniref:Uncharacterized protein n=1 Tax=Strongylus vulgaris TaxID=40348 RepID=A0A3P7JDP9_STRVU|nr:unnamed protein product [Strongylus vulgaris]